MKWGSLFFVVNWILCLIVHLLWVNFEVGLFVFVVNWILCLIVYFLWLTFEVRLFDFLGFWSGIVCFCYKRYSTEVKVLFKRLGVDPLVIELDEMGEFLQSQKLLLCFTASSFRALVFANWHWRKGVYFVWESYIRIFA